jgi:hypothetical protein
MKGTKRNFWIIWLVVMALSFVLLYAGVAILLGNPITVQNCMAFLILSFIFGVVSSTLYLLKQKTSCVLFVVGLIIGFFDMGRIFLSDMGGWGDLAGLMSLLTWVTIGLICGAAVALSRYVYKIISSHKSES